MKPLTQGNLDGLCGVYSILNALRIVEKTTLEESARVFFEIFAALETRKKISSLIQDGMTDRDMGYVYREIIQKNYPVRAFKPFHRKAEVPLGAYWSEVQGFLENGERRAVNLVLESWDWGHWTVIRRATSKSLFLFDSARMKRFDRRKCTTDRRLSRNRSFLIWPTTTRFLFRKESF
jgi:hypothetical protein